MEHYYSSRPTTTHDIRIVEYFIRGQRLELSTDSGVFSKGRVDFGTDLLINSMPDIRGQILDLGCGYGPIGISLAVLNEDCIVHMTDINERAVSLAKNNIERNQILNAKAYVSEGFSNISNMFDIIVTNPPIRAGKKVIYPLFSESIDYLNAGGAIYMVIQKKQGALSAVKKLNEIYSNCSIIAKRKGYMILRSIKS
ncbi:MAG: class I SAM-dependent methyltransferase [Clostridiales bacterium]|nr:class I SAM-dependent methyltransferase [Clostridiales bacterium]